MKNLIAVLIAHTSRQLHKFWERAISARFLSWMFQSYVPYLICQHLSKLGAVSAMDDQSDQQVAAYLVSPKGQDYGIAVRFTDLWHCQRDLEVSVFPLRHRLKFAPEILRLIGELSPTLGAHVTNRQGRLWVTVTVKGKWYFSHFLEALSTAIKAFEVLYAHAERVEAKTPGCLVFPQPPPRPAQ